MVEDHRHCVVCGKPVEPDKFVCSPSCEEIIKKQQKSVARSRMIMLMLIFIIILMFAVVSLLGK
jgi:predicted nucleic acid-binding Zn ribbon protein